MVLLPRPDIRLKGEARKKPFIFVGIMLSMRVEISPINYSANMTGAVLFPRPEHVHGKRAANCEPPADLSRRHVCLAVV